MKTAIIIVLCVVGYFVIGFGVLVLRAINHWVDEEDVAEAMLGWPIIGLVYVVSFSLEKLKNWARDLGGRVSIKVRKK